MSTDTRTASARPQHPRRGIHAPTASTPARAPGSLRRTATTDMLRPDGLRGDLVLIGRARDLFTDARGEARVLGESGYQARVGLDFQREVREIRTEPDRGAAQRLVGARASSGFRGAVDAALPAERDAHSLLYLLLDDLPVAALVSGYAVTAEIEIAIPPGQRAHQHPDLCAGWRTGGTILTGIEQQGRVPIATGPDAPSLVREGDPLAWHALPLLPPHGMRRHRRLDLRAGASLAVDVLFRDSHVAPDGRETIVHEYSLSAALDPDSLAITEIEATAGALPWVECNPAPASARRLVGHAVADLRPMVRAEFTGTTTCTHLNDTLRSLQDVVTLAPLLARSV
jgi:DUF2889 family protein